MDFWPTKVFVLCNVSSPPSTRSSGPTRCRPTPEQAATELRHRKKQQHWFNCKFLISLLHFFLVTHTEQLKCKAQGPPPSPSPPPQSASFLRQTQPHSPHAALCCSGAKALTHSALLRRTNLPFINWSSRRFVRKVPPSASWMLSVWRSNYSVCFWQTRSAALTRF